MHKGHSDIYVNLLDMQVRTAFFDTTTTVWDWIDD